MLLYVHPLVMLGVVCLVVVVAKLGLLRSAATRFGRNVVFPWKRHVKLGLFAMAGLIAGAGGGLFMTWLYWSAPLKTGSHAVVAMIIAALAVSGFLTGLMLNARRGPRNALALVHGAGNLVMAVLVVGQVSSGVEVIMDYLW